MEARQSVYRSDAQLRGMLDEHGTWVVHGHNNQVIGVGNSLRRALERASGYTQFGTAAVTVTRVPPNRIFVFHDQMVRLMGAAREADLTGQRTAIPSIPDLA
jgi:hypothetical protein